MNKQIQTEADELGFFGEYGGQYVPETRNINASNY